MLFLNNWVFILVAICCPVIPVLCVWCDVVILGAVLNECSVTEIVQEILLTVIVIIHMLLIIKYNEVRQCNILIAGFFSAMLFRELDAVFDLIGHGSWIYYSMTVSFLSLSYAIYNTGVKHWLSCSVICVLLTMELCCPEYCAHWFFPDYLECLSYGNLY